MKYDYYDDGFVCYFFTHMNNIINNNICTYLVVIHCHFAILAVAYGKYFKLRYNFIVIHPSIIKCKIKS